MRGFPEVTGCHRLLVSQALPVPITRVVRLIPLQVPGFEVPVAYIAADFSCLS